MGKVDESIEAEMNGSTAVAQYNPSGNTALGFHDDDQDRSFLSDMFRLQLVHKTSKISTMFDPGSLVLGGTELLFARQRTPKDPIMPPLRVIIATANAYWEEYLQSNGIPRTWPNKTAALAAGQICDWPPRGVEGPKPTASKAMQLKMLIAKPDGLLSSSFVLPIGGTDFTIAELKANKKSYDAVAGPIGMRQVNTDIRVKNAPTPAEGAALAHKLALHHAWFSLATELVPAKGPNGNDSNKLVLRYEGELSPADQKAVDEILDLITGATVREDVVAPDMAD